jgi:hypothetical protein
MPIAVARIHHRERDSGDRRTSHWTPPKVPPAIRPARMATPGVVTAPIRLASSPAIGKLRNARTQRSRKRGEERNVFMVDSFD